jgi:hypothetical protein
MIGCLSRFHWRRPVAPVRSSAVVSLLFAFGLLVGLGGAAIAVAGLLFVLKVAVRWLEALIVILESRIKEREPIS